MSIDPVKAWRIKKGDPIPQWLEKTTNCELFAGADLIVIEGEEIGFDVYLQDPDALDNAVMMTGKPINHDIEATVIGAPTNLKAPSGMWYELRGQKARLEALEAENAQLREVVASIRRAREGGNTDG